MCSWRVPRVMPNRDPRASGSQCGRSETDEGRDEIDSAGVRDRAGQDLRFGGRREDAQLIAEPLHHGAADEDRTFQRVLQAVAEVPGNRGEKPVAGHDRVPARAQEAETARCRRSPLPSPAPGSPGPGARPAGRPAPRARGCRHRGGCPEPTPKSDAEGDTSGSIARGMPRAERICSSHRPSRMS